MFEIALFIILIFICIYTIVDRICRCIEHGHTSKTYSIIETKKPKTDKQNIGF